MPRMGMKKLHPNKAAEHVPVRSALQNWPVATLPEES
jgi:hypothetical protein